MVRYVGQQQTSSSRTHPEKEKQSSDNNFPSLLAARVFSFACQPDKHQLHQAVDVDVKD